MRRRGVQRPPSFSARASSRRVPGDTVFPVAVAGRLLTAVGAVLLNVLLAKMVADWFSAREVVWAMSIAINAWPIGIGLALFVLPAIASTWGLAGVFYAAAVAAALACAAAAASGGVAVHAAMTRGVGLVSMAAVPWMLYNVGYAVVLSFVPVLLVSAGFSMERAGALLGLNTLLFIVSVQAGGAAAQWLARAEIVVAVGAVVLAGALATLPYAPPLALLVIAGLLGGLPAGALVAAPTAVLRPATRAAAWSLLHVVLRGHGAASARRRLAPGHLRADRRDPLRRNGCLARAAVLPRVHRPRPMDGVPVSGGIDRVRLRLCLLYVGASAPGTAVRRRAKSEAVSGPPGRSARPLTTSSARIRPVKGANLNPCPEQAEAKATRGSPGQWSMTKSSVGVIV